MLNQIILRKIQKKRVKINSLLFIIILIISSFYISPSPFHHLKQKTNYLQGNLTPLTNQLQEKIDLEDDPTLNSLEPPSWSWQNFTYKIPVNYSEKLTFNISQNNSLYLPAAKNMFINTSQLFYSPVDIITNNSINWQEPASYYSAVIQKNVDNVVLSYTNEGFLGSVAYNYYNDPIFKNDRFSFRVNITVRGDPTTDNGVPLVATYALYVIVSGTLYVFDYILYSEQPVSANTTTYYRIVKNSTLGQVTNVEFNLPMSLFQITEKENISMIKEVFTFTPGLSIEFSRPEISLTKQVPATVISLSSQATINSSANLEILTASLTPSSNSLLQIPSNSFGALYLDYSNSIFTPTNITLQDDLELSILNAFINYYSQPSSIMDIFLSLPFNCSFIATIGAEKIKINQKIVLNTSELINSFKSSQAIILSTNITSTFLSPLTLNHNINSSLDLNILENYSGNNTSFLFIYQNNTPYFSKMNPIISLLSKNTSIPLLLDYGSYWITYIMFSTVPAIFISSLKVTTYLSVLNILEKKTTFYRLFNNSILATYTRKSSNITISDVSWEVSIRSQSGVLNIKPTIIINENQTLLRFYIDGTFKPGTYNLTIYAWSTTSQNQNFSITIYLSNIIPELTIIDTTEDSIYLKILNQGITPIPNLLVSITNVISSSSKTNSSGVVHILFFETPPEIINLTLTYFDVQFSFSLNISEIKENYEPVITLVNTKIIANKTSYLTLNIKIPPLFSEWTPKIPNNYSIISLTKDDDISNIISLLNATNLKIKGDGNPHTLNLTLLILPPTLYTKKVSSDDTLFKIHINFYSSSIYLPISKFYDDFDLNLLNSTATYVKINETDKKMWIKLIITEPGNYLLLMSSMDGFLEKQDSTLTRLLVVLMIAIPAGLSITYFVKRKYKQNMALDFDL